MNVIFWHRRDLRIHDNAGLYKALESTGKVYPVFIFDNNILSHLPSDDKRVLFIYREVKRLKAEYNAFGSDLIVRFGDPLQVIPALAEELKVSKVFLNRDYEPYARNRDSQLHEILLNRGSEMVGAKDHVIFEKDEIVKADGNPYTVFTPYSRKWKEKLNTFFPKSYPTEQYIGSLQVLPPEGLIELSDLGFLDDEHIVFPERTIDEQVLGYYHQQRDIPSIKGTSRLSIHLRFGTISIRDLARKALQSNQTFLNELIWRDFYQMIIYHFPHSAKDAFKKQYDLIQWENDPALFKAWCEGRTGYPLVDAGMRELNETGFMHNRVRMVVASFLTKHLLIDWRWGEVFFAQKLLDYELASNVGGWQWAAGCGCDAAPYFRVFNPESQQQKFDPQMTYIRKWVPEFGTGRYPEPVVEHSFARTRAIDRFKQALNA